MAKEEFFLTVGNWLTDLKTGEPVYEEEELIYQDSQYRWSSEEAYLVDKYNIRLSNEFKQHALAASVRCGF